MGRTRVLLADDNEEILAELCRELENDFEIVSTVTDGQGAVDGALQLHPDVVVLDISMPILNGIQAALQMHHRQPHSRIIFLTIHENEEYIEAAFSAGARGYVTKRRLGSDLVRAIREVGQGNSFISPSLRRSAP